MIEIRSSTVNDSEAIRNLSVQLGYQPTLDTVISGLEAMAKTEGYEVVVITQNNVVAGWMSLGVRLRIEDVPFFEVLAIVTDEAKRGSGFGKALMRYAEANAHEKNIPLVLLYSNVIREESHKFYNRVGYQKYKQAFLFRRNIGE